MVPSENEFDNSALGPGFILVYGLVLSPFVVRKQKQIFIKKRLFIRHFTKLSTLTHVIHWQIHRTLIVTCISQLEKWVSCSGLWPASGLGLHFVCGVVSSWLTVMAPPWWGSCSKPCRLYSEYVLPLAYKSSFPVFVTPEKTVCSPDAFRTYFVPHMSCHVLKEDWGHATISLASGEIAQDVSGNI